MPTILPTVYTMEAWVRPAKIGAMSIIARSDESYPTAAWSHQLRINAAGCFEHYCEGDEKHSVCHTQPAVADRWYHVAGTATADDKLRLIIDGREEGTPVDIGALRPKLDRYFIGSATGDGVHLPNTSLAPLTFHSLTLSPRNPSPLAPLTPHPAPGIAHTHIHIPYLNRHGHVGGRHRGGAPVEHGARRG